MLRISGVTKAFPAKPDPVEALRGVDLQVARGSFTAVLGASGCGKTTLLRILAGFDRPDSGEVRLDGRLVAGSGTYVAPEHRNVGIVAQDGALFPHLDVASNIAYGLDKGWALWHSRRRQAERSERVEELLELVGLPGYGDRRPDELSGGQQQRVALARALAPEPTVILLDEPFSALDAGLRVELREDVREVLAKLGTTTVLVTHDQSEALSLADHVAIMRDGAVVQEGPPNEVYAHPGDIETAEFLGDAVILKGVLGPEFEFSESGACHLPREQAGVGLLSRPVVDSAFGVLRIDDAQRAVTGDVVRVILRPEQFELGSEGLDARVTGVNFYGHDGLVHLAVDDVDSRVTVRVKGTSLPRVGDSIRVRVMDDVVAHLSE